MVRLSFEAWDESSLNSIHMDTLRKQNHYESQELLRMWEQPIVKSILKALVKSKCEALTLLASGV